MNDNTTTLFASPTLVEHFVRGLVGICSLTWAVTLNASHAGVWTLASALLVTAIALFAFRGCPVCWSIGLAQTVWRTIKTGQTRNTNS